MEVVHRVHDALEQKITPTLRAEETLMDCSDDGAIRDCGSNPSLADSSFRTPVMGLAFSELARWTEA